MRLPVYIADAFSAGPFSGNPAAVVPLDDWIPDADMQAIAEQHNLAETAFVVVHLDEAGQRPLRWFTPAREVDLCGHATLATAFVLGDVLQFKEDAFGFTTRSGALQCMRGDRGWRMDFPADPGRPAGDALRQRAIAALPDTAEVLDVLEGRDDVLVVLAKAAMVESYVPDDAAIRDIPKRGLIVSARARERHDVVSRCFYPEFGVDEDAATGSAHTLIGPYWATRLGKSDLVCRQASRRGATLYVTYAGGDRVQLEGAARLYLHGELKY